MSQSPETVKCLMTLPHKGLVYSLGFGGIKLHQNCLKLELPPNPNPNLQQDA